MSKVSHTEVGWLPYSHSWGAMGLTCSISRAWVLSKMPKRALKPFQGSLAPNLGSHSHRLPPNVSSLSSNKNPAEDFPVQSWDGFLWFICHCEKRWELKEKRLIGWLMFTAAWLAASRTEKQTSFLWGRSSTRIFHSANRRTFFFS